MKLHNRRVLILWDDAKYNPTQRPKHKPVDGAFIYHSLFSVGAFASKKGQNPKQAITQRLAIKTTEKLRLDARALRNELTKMARELIDEVGDIEINPVKLPTAERVVYDESKITPETAMLIKIFAALDGYFIILYKAFKNGELTDHEQREKRKLATSKLQAFLTNTNKTCLSFHKVRKLKVETMA
ncbi:DUF1845 domain-containing protein [Vibrio sp. WXL210]|uniref:DUF1845 domain-containing protein n=1 Tax=Vibrio sp. WXL210 TaxID=3450709 RepID=UPI003EC5934D